MPLDLENKKDTILPVRTYLKRESLFGSFRIISEGDCDEKSAFYDYFV